MDLTSLSIKNNPSFEQINKIFFRTDEARQIERFLQAVLSHDLLVFEVLWTRPAIHVKPFLLGLCNFMRLAATYAHAGIESDHSRKFGTVNSCIFATISRDEFGGRFCWTILEDDFGDDFGERFLDVWEFSVVCVQTVQILPN